MVKKNLVVPQKVVSLWRYFFIKKMKVILLLLLIISSFTMCKQKPHSESLFYVDLDVPEKASLFDYFSSIELIPLETSHDVLIAGIRKIIVHQDKYYMLDPRQNIIFVFDLTGKYLFKIDKRGNGPGEYLSIRDFNISPISDNLEFLEPYGSVHTYDLSGNYIETKQISYPDFQAVHMFVPADSLTHIFYAIFQPKKIIYFNLDEKNLLHEELEEDWRLGSLAPKSLYSYRNEWYIFRPVNPVVYKIGKKQLEPAFQFDFGKYTRDGTTAVFSEESNHSASIYLEEVFSQFSYVITSVRHNHKYVFATLSWKDPNRRSNIIYDKTAGRSKFILEFSEQVMFNPDNGGEIIVTDDYVLICSQWIDLEKRIKKEMLDDKNKKIFEELQQASQEQNPVLIKYWFK